MRLTTTLLLLLLTGALGWVLLRESPVKKNGATISGEHIFSFDRKLATNITITGREYEIDLQRIGGEWRITKPVTDRANPAMAEGLMEALLRMENYETLSPSELGSDGLKRAGLNGSSISVEIRNDKALLASCRIGGRAMIEDVLYVSRSGPRGDVVVHAARVPVREAPKFREQAKPKFDLVAAVQLPPEAWRDAAILRFNPELVRHIELSAGTGLMDLQRDAAGRWDFVKPLKTHASSDRVNAVLNALLQLTGKPLDKATDASTPAATGALPAMKVSFTLQGSTAPVELSLQPPVDLAADIPATVTGRPGTFLLGPKAAAIWKLQPNDLRDQRLAIINPDTTTAIRIRSATYPEVALDNQGGVWQLKRFGQSVGANIGRIQQLFAELNAAQIREFAGDAVNNLEPYGLQQPFLEFEWTENNRVSVLKFGLAQENRIYCQHDNDSSIFRVSPTLLSSLPPDAVKWQSLDVLSVSTLAVRRIVISEDKKPALTLIYDGQTGDWSGELAGRDISTVIDREKAEALLNKLADFKADAWVTDRTEGYLALKNPVLTVQVFAIDIADLDAAPTPRTLVFAPAATTGSTTSSLYGRLDQNPDLFLINREQFREILTPVVK